jgi:uncharacterized protein YbcI
MEFDETLGAKVLKLIVTVSICEGYLTWWISFFKFENRLKKNLKEK